MKKNENRNLLFGSHFVRPTGLRSAQQAIVPVSWKWVDSMWICCFTKKINVIVGIFTKVTGPLKKWKVSVKEVSLVNFVVAKIRYSDIMNKIFLLARALKHKCIEWLSYSVKVLNTQVLRLKVELLLETYYINFTDYIGKYINVRTSAPFEVSSFSFFLPSFLSDTSIGEVCKTSPCLCVVLKDYVL